MALAVGEEVEARGEDLLEELGAPAAAVEDDGDPALADESAHLLEELREHLDQAGVGLGGDDEERIAPGVVDPVVGGGGHREAHARHVGFGEVVLAVVDAHVAIDVEEAQRGAAGRDASLGQDAAEARRAAAAARRASLRRSVLTSGARSSPSTRPRSAGECSLSASGRLMRNSAISRSARSVVRRP